MDLRQPQDPFFHAPREPQWKLPEIPLPHLGPAMLFEEPSSRPSTHVRPCRCPDSSLRSLVLWSTAQQSDILIPGDDLVELQSQERTATLHRNKR